MDIIIQNHSTKYLYIFQYVFQLVINGKDFTLIERITKKVVAFFVANWTRPLLKENWSNTICNLSEVTRRNEGRMRQRERERGKWRWGRLATKRVGCADAVALSLFPSLFTSHKLTVLIGGSLSYSVYVAQVGSPTNSSLKLTTEFKYFYFLVN